MKRPLSDGRRRLFAALGILFTAIGVVGIITPVLPTTIWLLLASGLFVKASPRLHRWLHANRMTGPYLRAYTEGAGLSRGRKIAAIATLWASLLISGWFVRGHPWVLALLVVVGVGVTIHVVTIRAHPQRRGSTGESR